MNEVEAWLAELWTEIRKVNGPILDRMSPNIIVLDAKIGMDLGMTPQEAAFALLGLDGKNTHRIIEESKRRAEEEKNATDRLPH